MALQVKALATKSDHLSSVPGTHMVEGEKQNKDPPGTVAYAVNLNTQRDRAGQTS